MKNCDEMFFGRTEKSGNKMLVGRRTENGKEECNCFYAFFKKFQKAQNLKPFFGYVLAT
jgi:hypothetical protein